MHKTYGYQVWASASKGHINKIQIIQNKFLLIILNKQSDIIIVQLHELANISTIKQYIQNSLPGAYNNNRRNPLIRETDNYQVGNIPLKVKVRLPKHAIT